MINATNADVDYCWKEEVMMLCYLWVYLIMFSRVDLVFITRKL